VAAHPVTILADTRERRAAVGGLLGDLDVRVEWHRLDVGDYLVAPGMAVERKTVADLHRSVHSGRLWTQITVYKRRSPRVYLLVEGRDVLAGPISDDGIRGALLAVIDQGVPLLRSIDQTDSALWLRRLAVRAARARPRLELRRSHRNNVSPVAVLSTLPGISPRLARHLIDRFGSISALTAASVEELRFVPGIGAVRAETIHHVLTGRFAAQR
jgi:DNA excision repair protein ERCC-4